RDGRRAGPDRVPSPRLPGASSWREACTTLCGACRWRVNRPSTGRGCGKSPRCSCPRRPSWRRFRSPACTSPRVSTPSVSSPRIAVGRCGRRSRWESPPRSRSTASSTGASRCRCRTGSSARLSGSEAARMENVNLLLHGFEIAFSLNHLWLLLVGVILGILVGVLPGLGAPNGVSLLLPLTFAMQPVSAIILLSSMYWGALFGGSVTSILFNIPGEPSSVATTFDGYPMARGGRPTTALATAFGSAAFGALVGVILITFLASWVAQVALAFGPAEYFAVYFLAFASFVGMGGSPPVKTIGALAI